MTKNNTREGLVQLVEGGIRVLELYVSGEEAYLGTPALKIGGDGLEYKEGRRVINYSDVLNADECFVNFSAGLVALGHDISNLEKRYNDIRDKCETIPHRW